MIDRALVLRLAAAARIDLAPEEVDRLAAQLTEILAQIEPLRACASPDESDVQAAQHPLRDDVPGADPLHGTIKRFAPEVKDGFFTVPLVPTHGGGA